MADSSAWNRILRPEDLGDQINVEVAYYSKKHLQKILESFPSRKAHLPKDGAMLSIPAVEFLTYWLFEDKDEDDPLSSSFEVLSQSVKDAIPALKRYFEQRNGDVRARARKKWSERPTEISARLGVSVGLSVANVLLGCTRADWIKIEKTYTHGKENPRMDYRLATMDDGYVAVEDKGCIAADNRLKSSGVSRHLSSIEEKKAFVRETDKNVPLIGTIAVADDRDDSTLRCWLLDPPLPNPIDMDPEVFRLVARLTYHRQLLRCVFPRWFELHRAMGKRIEGLRRLNHWEGFQGSRLRTLMGDHIRAKWDAPNKPQALTKNGRWVGVVRPCGSDQLLFVGVSKNWLEAILAQDLATLLEIASRPISEKVTLRWRATERQAIRLKNAGAEIEKDANEERYRVLLPGVLHQSSSGFAFSLIPVRRER